MDVPTTLLYLLGPFIPLLLGFAFRKRLKRWFSRILLDGIAEWAFVSEEVTDEDGTTHLHKALSGPAKAVFSAIVPVLVSEAVKSVKLKHGPLPALPEGINLGNLSEALPALLASGMVPKKYAGIVALAAPFLQNFLPKGGGTVSKPGATVVPKELEL